MGSNPGMNMGSLSLDTTRPAEVTSYITRRLTRRIGDVPVKKGGSIRIGWQFFCDNPLLQITDPKADNDVSIESDTRAKLQPALTTWWGVYGFIYFPEARPMVKVVEGELKPRDTVTFIIGDTRHGSKGFRVQSFATPSLKFLAEMDPLGYGQKLYIDEIGFPIVAGQASGV